MSNGYFRHEFVIWSIDNESYSASIGNDQNVITANLKLKFNQQSKQNRDAYPSTTTTELTK